ncbi:hypothetical protein [Candidatus Nitrosocosmicus sp. SS]|uniref:hypothetical protein n=1 Tax=Candidatus Nitrosocosmicus agrestis TaxID=2563600 RepID=UPI00122E5DED|nr:hypothetical protein [Candidatus Nitrosocosmicus sp. SS]KAA2279384.1 hypothetical protein F1Z66_13420 [Candidatus Nitrosocosmicus sp. SS]KAF0868072.1 hypothetical protein E5N71_11965 [Candidatus Nitrosocosmicus sp. SS]
MKEFVGAVDETEDGEYIAFMICNHESLIKNIPCLPKNFTHLTSVFYSTDRQQQIINSFDFSQGVLICCIKFGISSLRKEIDNSINFGKMPQVKFRSKISYRMRKHLNSICSRFLDKHRIKINEVQFQVDNGDIRGFLMQGGLKCVESSYAHKIADCIAYANHRGWPLKGDHIIEKGEDFRLSFRDQIIKDLKL